MTTEERALLDCIETHAANLSNINAMLEVFTSNFSFSCDLPEQNRRMLLFYSGICDLLGFYAQELRAVIKGYYPGDGL